MGCVGDPWGGFLTTVLTEPEDRPCQLPPFVGKGQLHLYTVMALEDLTG